MKEGEEKVQFQCLYTRVIGVLDAGYKSKVYINSTSLTYACPLGQCDTSLSNVSNTEHAPCLAIDPTTLPATYSTFPSLSSPTHYLPSTTIIPAIHPYNLHYTPRMTPYNTIPTITLRIGSQ